jgi:hypothetical protein
MSSSIFFPLVCFDQTKQRPIDNDLATYQPQIIRALHDGDLSHPEISEFQDVNSKKN